MHTTIFCVFKIHTMVIRHQFLIAMMALSLSQNILDNALNYYMRKYAKKRQTRITA